MRKLVAKLATATMATLAILGICLAMPASGAPTMSPQAAACGQIPPNLDPTTARLSNFSVTLHTGIGTSCPISGVAQPGDLVDYFCFTNSTGGTWTYLRDLRTGVAGWARDDLLPNNGSVVFCGF